MPRATPFEVPTSSNRVFVVLVVVVLFTIGEILFPGVVVVVVVVLGGGPKPRAAKPT